MTNVNYNADLTFGVNLVRDGYVWRILKIDRV
jgi:hypothetical protein